MANLYRRRQGRDTWHFCSNCYNWPTSGYYEQAHKPTSGELCDECKGKQRNNNCSY